MKKQITVKIIFALVLLAATVFSAACSGYSEYKGAAGYDTLVSRLESLDLSDDPYKQEFRRLVTDYANKKAEKAE